MNTLEHRALSYCVSINLPLRLLDVYKLIKFIF
jgi:hypothetical protein